MMTMLWTTSTITASPPITPSRSPRKSGGEPPRLSSEQPGNTPKARLVRNATLPTATAEAALPHPHTLIKQKEVKLKIEIPSVPVRKTMGKMMKREGTLRAGRPVVPRIQTDRETMHMPIRPTAPRIQTDIELKRPTTQISRNGKPKGPRRHVERIESPITPSYSSSDNASISSTPQFRIAEGPYSALSVRQKATEKKNLEWLPSRDSLSVTSSVTSHPTSPLGVPLSAPPRSDFGFAMAARALMTQEKPVFKARTMAKALDVTHVGTGIPLNPSFSQDTLTTSMGSMEAGSLSDGFGGESTTSRSDGIPPSSASYAGRRASVRWADMNGDHEGSVTTGRSRMPSDRLSLFKITTSTSSGSASEAHTRRGSILADFLSRRESTMKMEESKDSKVPLRWREAHPEPVTPKLGPCIHNHFETQGGGFEEELVNDSFVLDNIESGPAMPKVSASHSLPIRSLVPSTFPHRYVQAEVETPITVVTVSSAETRALQRQQKQEQNASKDAITPDASLTSASQNSSLVYNRSNAFRQPVPMHRTWVFRLLLLLILLHGVAALLSVSAYNDFIKPSRGMPPDGTDAGGTGLPLDPFKGSIDPRYQTTKTAIETAGVAGATGYAILICATVRSRTGRPSRWCRGMGIFAAWAFAGIAGVSSVILLVGTGDGKDLRGQSCRRMGSTEHGVIFAGVCGKATASAVVGLLNGCVWFLVGLFELLTTDGRDSAKK